MKPEVCGFGRLLACPLSLNSREEVHSLCVSANKYCSTVPRSPPTRPFLSRLRGRHFWTLIILHQTPSGQLPNNGPIPSSPLFLLQIELTTSVLGITSSCDSSCKQLRSSLTLSLYQYIADTFWAKDGPEPALVWDCVDGRKSSSTT